MFTNTYDVLLGDPHFYITDCNISDFCDFQWKLNRVSQKNIFAGMIRGQKCKTLNGLYDEFSAVLQFPYYFGENWDAFNDCLNDLDWIAADAFVLCISNAENITHLGKSDFVYLLELLSTSAKEWESGRECGAHSTPPTPFKILFHCEKSKFEGFSLILRDMGIRLETLQVKM